MAPHPQQRQPDNFTTSRETAAASYGIQSSWYLTDVFGGFEIWNGGSGGNLSVDEFKCVVAK